MKNAPVVTPEGVLRITARMAAGERYWRVERAGAEEDAAAPSANDPSDVLAADQMSWGDPSRGAYGEELS
jgi:hypothetical protein